MASRTLAWPAGIARRRAGDALLVSLAGLHAVALLTMASIPVVAIGMWWNANAIAHNFIHRPFFRAAPANRMFSALSSLLLGIPQSYWRQRHLAHHAGAGRAARLADRAFWRRDVAIEGLLVVGLWTVMAVVAPVFLLTVYLPGYGLGLLLCALQGHYEHAGGTTSHYGWLYNTLFFNDGYHVEHHRRPHAHWTELRGDVRPATRSSRWPAVLRWMDGATVRTLDALERLVLRSPALQQFVVDRHERAFRRVLADAGPIGRVTIVGGGLFPRTAIVLRRVLPRAALRIVEASGANLAACQGRVDPRVDLVLGRFETGDVPDADLLVLPLAYAGDRSAVYRNPPAEYVVVHDWIWARRGRSACVSWLLLKRLNLIRR